MKASLFTLYLSFPTKFPTFVESHEWKRFICELKMLVIVRAYMWYILNYDNIVVFSIEMKIRILEFHFLLNQTQRIDYTSKSKWDKGCIKYKKTGGVSSENVRGSSTSVYRLVPEWFYWHFIFLHRTLRLLSSPCQMTSTDLELALL